jgi:chromosomal replication initiation ATPase DnaA
MRGASDHVSSVTADSLMTQVTSKWDEPARNEDVDPRFESASVASFIRAVCNRVVALVGPYGIGSGGNMVLQGPTGVGKTTLLKALNHCLPRAVDDARIEVVIYSLEDSKWNDDNCSRRVSVAEWSNASTNSRLVLLVDDIQCLP